MLRLRTYKELQQASVHINNPFDTVIALDFSQCLCTGWHVIQLGLLFVPSKIGVVSTSSRDLTIPLVAALYFLK